MSEELSPEFSPAVPSNEVKPGRRIWRPVVLVLMLGIALGGVALGTRNLWSAKRFGVVIPGLVYRSGQISRWVLPGTLKQNQIRVIVDLTKWEPENRDQQFETKVSEEMGISHFRCGLNGDGTGDLNHFVAALQLLHDCEQRQLPVLVHCAAGAQRTGAVVASYQLLFHQKNTREIVREMERFGFNAARHWELLEYLDRNLPEIAARLQKAGTLSRVPETIPSLADSR